MEAYLDKVDATIVDAMEQFDFVKNDLVIDALIKVKPEFERYSKTGLRVISQNDIDKDIQDSKFVLYSILQYILKKLKGNVLFNLVTCKGNTETREALKDKIIMLDALSLFLDEQHTINNCSNRFTLNYYIHINRLIYLEDDVISDDLGFNSPNVSTIQELYNFITNNEFIGHFTEYDYHNGLYIEIEADDYTHILVIEKEGQSDMINFKMYTIKNNQ